MSERLARRIISILFIAASFYALFWGGIFIFEIPDAGGELVIAGAIGLATAAWLWFGDQRNG